MSGQNVPILDLPPGVWRNGTPYSTGRRWREANWMRWVSNLLTPIGGWVKTNTFGVSGEVVRDAFSWRDNTKIPWYAVGTESHLYATSPDEDVNSIYDITPTGLVSNIARKRGYGSGTYGNGRYGASKGQKIDAVGQWSMDNFGRQLVAVHNQDGRLFMWDPVAPSVIAAPVAGAPIDSNLVLVTDERMVMLFGGKNNPRRVKWCSRENLTDWTPTATNTAGGFDLHSSGTIISACKVQGGILVITDIDTHIIEYIGAPNYYSRRRISEEVGVIAKNALVSVTGGAFWLNNEGFWRYDGQVTPVPSSVDVEVLKRSNLAEPSNIFLGYNGHNREIWCFYPAEGSSEPDRYVFVSVAAEPYWSMGKLKRTAWLNPIWQSRPYMYHNRYEFAHELGVYADGESRVGECWAETGQFEIGEGERSMWVDRVWQDGQRELVDQATDKPAYNFTFKLRQSPVSPQRVFGPYEPNNQQGYTNVRFRARAMAMRVTQALDAEWTLGKLRLRLKPGGAR